MAVLLPVLSGNALAAVEDDVLVYPGHVDECLRNPKAQAADLDVLTSTNPFYLRGDFDADGRVDYTLRVRSKTKGGFGLLFCMGNGKVILLGSGVGERTFSDMENDMFFGMHWAVYTKQEVYGLRAYRSNVPRPIPCFAPGDLDSRLGVTQAIESRCNR